MFGSFKIDSGLVCVILSVLLDLVYLRTNFYICSMTVTSHLKIDNNNIEFVIIVVDTQLQNI